ncbi:hypothetical protein DICSQDRAFT_171848 [Dichomitus squalens LYAD-421 SS1]|uniref:DUF6533 domain-containing protein n=2 Tax=Dichomitus squalens TaxID=114155 RepID=A0A4V2K6N0_9APHY|nr:uncharacterized protein DICSQDRAFT_171848 [Dichomitus squalens LYAD-421 SS1]EJF59671.1 hypothetical protein DICSQDRAFT_171848 [Dichomitus squalens LYAD-421 SS1]TBU52863.1 hypothetical protein BD310DRAFT_981526 [Dichomitus squalens]
MSNYLEAQAIVTEARYFSQTPIVFCILKFEPSVLRFNTNCELAALTLFLYDCLVTIDSEVTLFWLPGRVNGAVSLFLVNRYFTLVAQILGFAPQPKKFNRYT